MKPIVFLVLLTLAPFAQAKVTTTISSEEALKMAINSKELAAESDKLSEKFEFFELRDVQIGQPTIVVRDISDYVATVLFRYIKETPGICQIQMDYGLKLKTLQNPHVTVSVPYLKSVKSGCVNRNP